MAINGLTPLRKALNHLKDIGKIKNDSDVVELLKMDKGNFSKLVKSISPSEDKIEIIEKTYGIKISNFEDEVFDVAEAVREIKAVTEVSLSALAQIIAHLNGNVLSDSVKKSLEDEVNALLKKEKRKLKDVE